MTIYQYRNSVLTSSGSTSSTTLRVPGGLCRQVMIVAATSTTTFAANLQDESSLRVLDWGVHTGTLNDIRLSVPVSGRYTVNITNASPDDTFSILMAVEE